MPAIVITPPATQSSLTVGGVSVGMPGPVYPRRLVAHCRHGTGSFSFQVKGGALPVGADPYLGQEARLTVNGTLRHVGNVVSVFPQYQEWLGWVRSYQSVSLDERANYFPHTDQNDTTDNSTYNAQQDSNTSEYFANRAGRTVGQILTDVLTMTANATALNAAGLMGYTSMSPPTLPAATVSDLAALSRIPPAVVRFGGEKFYGALLSFVSTQCPHHTLYFTPAGVLRVIDLRTYTPYTFTMGADPVELSPVSYDLSECFPRVVVRGEPVAEMFNLTLGNTGLNETPFAHDGLTIAQAKAAWTPADFLSPGLPAGQATGYAIVSGGALSSVTPGNQGYGYSTAPAVAVVGGGGSGATVTSTITGGKVTGYTVTAGGTGYTTAPNIVVAAAGGSSRDSGTCTCPSTTTVTVTSADKGARWGLNYWDQTAGGRHGSIFLSFAAGSGITQFAQRQIVSNTAMTPGGTSTITLDRALPATNYDGYMISGTTKGPSAVWCLYGVTDPTIASKLTNQSTYPFAYHLSDLPSITMTSTPIGAVLWSPSGLPPYQEWVVPVAVDPGSGTVRFSYPTYLSAGRHTPTDVRALVPVNVGANTVASPADVGGVPQYTGTSAAYISPARTLTVTCHGWRDPGQVNNVQLYADELLDSVKNVVAESTVVYYGLFETALTPGMSVNVAGSGYTTGWESLALANVETTLEWNADGVNFVTTMKCNNRRAHLSAEAFLHPDRTGLTFDFDGGFNLANLATVADAGAALSAAAGYVADNRASSGADAANYAGADKVAALAAAGGSQWEGGIFAPMAAGNGVGRTAEQAGNLIQVRGNDDRIDTGQFGQQARMIDQQNANDSSRRGPQERSQKQAIADQDEQQRSRQSEARRTIADQQTADRQRNQTAEQARKQSDPAAEQRQAQRQAETKRMIAERDARDRARNEKPDTNNYGGMGSINQGDAG